MAGPYTDEPTFTLRAQDRFAPEILEAWADKVERAVSGSIGERPDLSKGKVKRARALAHTMRAWQTLNHCKVPD